MRSAACPRPGPILETGSWSWTTTSESGQSGP
jgi:hypothetical protein